MILENLLRGMTVPGRVPRDRIDNMTKQLSMDQQSIFIIQNLVGEIVRLRKLLAKKYGLTLNSDITEFIGNIEKIAIARKWGVNRHAFLQIIEKMQVTGSLRRKQGSGAPISVMTDAVKRKLVQILLQNKGDIDFQT